MITPEQFLIAQKQARATKKGWRKAGEFRPFRELVICSDCGNYMTPALSKGKNDNYLNITCGNKLCTEKRREEGKKPISNTIRGAEIVKTFIEVVEKQLEVDKETYNKAKEIYFKEKNNIVTNLNERIRKSKISLTKQEETAKKYSDKLINTTSEVIEKQMRNDYEILLSEIKTTKDLLKKLEKESSEYDYQMDSDFPEYKDFLNFFKNVVKTIENTDDAYLIDQLVRLVFLNTTVKDKKVVKWELREPFQTYNTLENLHGVEDGT